MRLITLVLAVAAMAVAAPNGNGNDGGGGKSCTQDAPAVAIDNNYGWSQWGSWGLPSQQLTYAVKVIKYDVDCGSSSFVVDVSAPSGFAVSPGSTTVSVGSGSVAYVFVLVTSPSSAPDGN